MVMNADGSGVMAVTPDPVGRELSPIWSPDGQKIAFNNDPQGGACYPCDFDIYTVNSGGGGLTRLTSTPSTDFAMDWQPLFKGFARPRGATPINIRFVPAFEQCTDPNGSHGSPFDVASCNPPQEASDYLTATRPRRIRSRYALIQVTRQMSRSQPRSPMFG
jgi:hypothetical protein